MKRVIKAIDGAFMLGWTQHIGADEMMQMGEELQNFMKDQAQWESQVHDYGWPLWLKCVKATGHWLRRSWAAKFLELFAVS